MIERECCRRRGRPMVVSSRVLRRRHGGLGLGFGSEFGGHFLAPPPLSLGDRRRSTWKKIGGAPKNGGKKN